MIQVSIGKNNKLRVIKIVDFGVYLDGGDRGEILLPNEYVPKGCSPEDFVNVFLYFDSEDRLIATTEVPYIRVEEFSCMKVIATGKFGAFMDWGLRKDLFIPFREQGDLRLQEGQIVPIYAYFDKDTDRIVGTTRIDRFLDNTPPEYEKNQEVDILIVRKSNIGYNVIINNAHWGVIFFSDVFQPLRIGQKTKGYIKQIREDEKIDVVLNKMGLEQTVDIRTKIIQQLKANNGILDICDKTSPEIIYNLFGCSKKNFKKAIGMLYKNRDIEITDSEIKLIEEE